MRSGNKSKVNNGGITKTSLKKKPSIMSTTPPIKGMPTTMPPTPQGMIGGQPSIAATNFFPPLNVKSISELFNGGGNAFSLQTPANNILNSRVLTAAHNFFHNLNTSTFFAGFVMIVLNIGSRYIQFDLNETTEGIFKYLLSKELLVFAVAWMGTRNIYYALVITACFTIIADHLMNANSRFCILPQKFRDMQKLVDTNKDGVVSDLEISSAMATLEKAKAQKVDQHNVALVQYHQLFKDNSLTGPDKRQQTIIAK
jgi:hypothetical protein